MRLAVVSDIHSNLAALREVLSDIEGQSIDKIWCLGDLVGYGPKPNSCVQLIQEHADLCIGGNHDLAVLGLMDLEHFNPDAAAAAIWTSEVLTDESREYLAPLVPFQIHGDFTLAHGSPRHPIWEYMFEPEVVHANLALMQTRLCLVGHTHWPTVWQDLGEDELPEEPIKLEPDEPFALDGRRLVLNPGSVGQPRDNDPRASYLIIDLNDCVAICRRIVYDVEETQRQMQRAGLPLRLIERLSAGW